MKKGFTLIEILAVIVVLAVIALITTPIILNVIEKAKKGALEDSAYGLIESANIYYASGTLDETNTKTEFTFQDGVQTSENKLSYKGKVENGSVRLYSDGKTALCITGGNYAALKNVNDKKVTMSKGRCSYNTETEEYETIGLCQGLQDEMDQMKQKYEEELKKQEEEFTKKWNDFMSNFIGITWDFGYTGAEQTFQIPYEGYYQLEIWGASSTQTNGTVYGTGYPGYAGYATGVYKGNKGDKLYIVVGGQGGVANCADCIGQGGYNGGGSCRAYNDGTQYCSGGGGATHIALTSGLLKSLFPNRDQILMVAGGAGGSWSHSSQRGGLGGGYMTDSANQIVGNNGGSFGQGGSYNVINNYVPQCYPANYGAGGGGGWFGGQPKCFGVGAGGSGYIGNSLLVSYKEITKHMTCHSCRESTEENIYTISTTNSSQIATSDYTKLGPGYAKITYLGYE